MNIARDSAVLGPRACRPLARDSRSMMQVMVTWHRGEPHAGERPDRSPGWSASEAGMRSDAGTTD
jgi:hypothetical protein